MKNKLLILAGIFLFFHFSFPLSCFFPQYKIKDKKVYYQGISGRILVDEADIETFKDLDGNFGTDTKYVYYQGKILSNLDAKTFEIVSKYKPKPIKNSPWGIGCQTSYVTKFKDKNGVYSLKDIGILKLEASDFSLDFQY